MSFVVCILYLVASLFDKYEGYLVSTEQLLGLGLAHYSKLLFYLPWCYLPHLYDHSAQYCTVRTVQ